jgi:hypothetical protein
MVKLHIACVYSVRSIILPPMFIGCAGSDHSFTLRRLSHISTFEGLSGNSGWLAGRCVNTFTFFIPPYKAEFMSLIFLSIHLLLFSFSLFNFLDTIVTTKGFNFNLAGFLGFHSFSLVLSETSYLCVLPPTFINSSPRNLFTFRAIHGNSHRAVDV